MAVAILVATIIVALFASPALAAKGATIKYKTDTSDYSCLRKQGYSFAVVRAQTLIGMLDPHLKSNVESAHEAGMSFVDVFMHPCLECSTPPETQVDKVIAAIKNLKYRKLWIMVMQIGGWKKDKAFNCRYLKSLVHAGMQQQGTVGIGTNIGDWFKIMGAGCEMVEDRPELWWIRHDESENLAGLERFALLHEPIMKEYKGPIRECGTEVNANFVSSQKQEL
ncbi:MAG: hypothetical protein P4M11_12955 [Candidatus Pacebacteria bacterium]|nr:hypothetical protein [Candidatus Paceibacterota bacterium]